MKALGVGSLLIAAAALSGCTASLQPFYTSATLLDNRAIEGRWTDGETVWQVVRTAPGRFEIATCGDDGACKPETVAVLFRVADVTFLDFQEKRASTFDSTIRPHGVFQVQLNDDSMDLAMLDPDRIAKLAKDRRLDTDFADLETGVLLTAAPENLQSFLLRHVSDPQIFEESHHLYRRPESR